MSRAAVKAKQKARRQERAIEQRQMAERRRRAERDRLAAEMEEIEAGAALHAVLVRCDGCGLEQVATGSVTTDGRSSSCVLCGSEVGTFVEWLPGCHMVETALRAA